MGGGRIFVRKFYRLDVSVQLEHGLKRCVDTAMSSSQPMSSIKPIRPHERHTTLTHYRDKITIPRGSDSYDRNIMHQTDLYLRQETPIFGPPMIQQENEAYFTNDLHRILTVICNLPYLVIYTGCVKKRVVLNIFTSYIKHAFIALFYSLFKRYFVYLIVCVFQSIDNHIKRNSFSNVMIGVAAFCLNKQRSEFA